jgi:nondiscriminating aspartyl-tRNA synthetase
LIVGGVPPFGILLNLETFFDEKIKSLANVAFNCGFPIESILMQSKDLISIVQPQFGNFSK